MTKSPLRFIQNERGMFLFKHGKRIGPRNAQMITCLRNLDSLPRAMIGLFVCSDNEFMCMCERQEITVSHRKEFARGWLRESSACSRLRSKFTKAPHHCRLPANEYRCVVFCPFGQFVFTRRDLVIDLVDAAHCSSVVFPL